MISHSSVHRKLMGGKMGEENALEHTTGDPEVMLLADADAKFNDSNSRIFADHLFLDDNSLRHINYL